jgi:hypothetical protein
MALLAYALTTPQRAADFLGLGTLVEGSANYSLLERLCNSVTEYVENYVGFRVKKTTYSNELYNTEDGSLLVLKNFPVDSSETFVLQRRNSALNEDEWETVDGEYYHVDYGAGIIEGAGGWNFSRTKNGFRVSYTAGYNFDNSDTFLSDAGGADLEMAAWLLISSVFNRGKGGGGIQSESIGDYRVVYASAMFENKDVKDILDKYQRLDFMPVITPPNS